MTIAVEQNRVVYTGNGSATNFAASFSAMDEADVEVYIYEIATGILTGPLNDVLYTVNDVPGDTFSVDYPLSGSPLSSTHKLIIQRIVPLLQPATFSNSAGFDPATLTLQLDEMVRMSQQINDGMQRALKVDISGTQDPDDIMETLEELAAIETGGVVLKNTLMFNVKDYGALGDGLTDDSAAIQEALDAAKAAGGGIVFVPPTGFPYIIGTGLSVAHGCVLAGVSGRNYWADFNSPPSDWARYGTWLQPTDLVNPAVTLDAPAKIKGISFVYEQPEPTGAPWTPTTYPYTIEMNWIMSSVEDVMIIGGTHGINMNFPETGIEGTFCVLRNLWIDTFIRGIRFKSINDTLLIDNIRHRGLLYIGDPDVTDYRYANKIDWDVNYLDNAQCTNIEFYQSRTSILITDATSDYGGSPIVMGCSHLQLNNISFNQVYQAIRVANGTTTAKLHMANILVQTDTDNGQADNWCFDLNSNNVLASFVHVYGGFIGKGFMRIGGGTGGKVSITDILIEEYAQLGGGENCFSIAAGATLDIPTGIQSIVGDVAAGAVFAGAGTVKSIVHGSAVFGETFIQSRRTGNYPTFQTYRYDAHGSAQFIGAWDVFGKDSAGNDQPFAQWAWYVSDATSGSEDAEGQLRVNIAGVQTLIGTFGAEWTVPVPTNWNGIATFTNTGLHVLDTNASHDLILKPGSDLTADRTLTITTGDADRTLNISAGNVTVSTFGASIIDDANSAAVQTTLGFSAAVQSLLDDANLAAMQATLGLGRVLLASGTVSAAAQQDLVLTSYTGYRAIEVELINFRPATDGVGLQVRFSTNGGSSYDAGASDYAYALDVITGGGVASPVGSIAGTAIALGHPSALVGNGTNEGWSGDIKLRGQTSAAFYSRLTFQGAYIDNTATPQYISTVGAGWRAAAQDTDALRIMFSSGNITSGTYAVYGLL